LNHVINELEENVSPLEEDDREGHYHRNISSDIDNTVNEVANFFTMN